MSYAEKYESLVSQFESHANRPLTEAEKAHVSEGLKHPNFFEAAKFLLSKKE